MNKEPHGTLEVSKDVVFQLKSMAHNSAGLKADGSPDDPDDPDDEYPLDNATPPGNPKVPDPDTSDV